MTIQFRTFLLYFSVAALMNVVHNARSWATGSYYYSIDEVEGTGILVTASDYKEGQLWLGTNNGLAVISPNYEKIFNVRSGHLTNDFVWDVLIEQDRVVWASIRNGIFKYDFHEGHYQLLSKDNGIPESSCVDLEHDKLQNVIFGVCGAVLVAVNPEDLSIETTALTEVLKYPGDSLRKIKVVNNKELLLSSYAESMLYERSSGKITRKFEEVRALKADTKLIDEEHFLVAAKNGLHLYNINQNKAIKHIKLSREFGLVNDSVSALNSFSANEIVVMTESHGIYLFNTNTHKLSEASMFYPYLSSKYVPTALTYKGIDDGFAISTYENGIQIHPGTYQFLGFFEKNNYKIPDVFFSKKSNEQVLFGNEQALYLLDIKSREITRVAENLGTLLDGIVYKDGYLVQSDQKGLVLLDSDGGILSEGFSFEGLPDSIKTDVNRFLELGNGELLLGLYGDNVKDAGLYKGNFEIGFKSIVLGDNISDLVKSPDGNIFAMAPQTGIFKINQDYQATHYEFPGYIGYLDCVEQLNTNQLLLCTRTTGVILFDTLTGEFKQAFQDSEYLSKVIRDIYVDINNRIWLMTGNGLVTYEDLDDKGFHFGSSDGIVSKEFALNSAIAISDAEFMVFGNKDVFSIKVSEAEEYIKAKRLQITAADIVDFSASKISNRNESFKHLNKDFIEKETLEFPHDILNLRLRFTHDNLIDKELIRYEIKLEGLEEDWRMLDKGENSVTFSTLPPGNYSFLLRAHDPRSFESQPFKRIDILVDPPWWQTVYAYIIYVLFFIVIVYLTQWLKSRQLKQKNLELAEKVKERTATIENLLNQKQTFFANVSHEFRTPLSLIMGPIDFLAERLKSHEDKHQLSIMKRNTNRLMRLVDQILELAKFETSKHLPKEIYEIKNVLDVLTSSFSSLLEAKQQILTIEVDKNLKVRLIQDSLEMILGNLISNSIKYCPEGAKVSIVSSEENGKLKIVVSDNGKGIEPENLKVLFERFTRFDAGEDVQGSGIGLALVKQLVVSNGGQIEVKSAVNVGTTFTIHFPIDVSQSESATHVARPQIFDTAYDDSNEDVSKQDTLVETKEETVNVNAVNKFKLLIVEDNADLRSYLTESLSSEYEIELAKNGEEGLKKAQQNIPDLILSDVLMPKMNGYELSNAIRSDDSTSHIPIILLTAKGDDLSRMKGWEENVDDYLTKPFKLKELRSRISRLISIRDILKKKHTSELNNNLAIKNNEAISFQTKRDKEFFVRFEKVISEHYDEESFSRTEAASYMALSERQLNRKLSALVDYNFSEYLRKYRLQKGRDLLLSGKQVTEVAYEVGFNSPSYFSSCFKAEFEQTPKQYVELRESQSISN